MGNPERKLGKKNYEKSLLYCMWAMVICAKLKEMIQNDVRQTT